MTTRVPTDPALLLAAARLADLPLDARRAEQLAPAMDGFYQMLAPLNQADHGEAAPAFAFRAGWPAR